jgi:hypothetical protein
MRSCVQSDCLPIFYALSMSKRWLAKELPRHYFANCAALKCWSSFWMLSQALRSFRLA